MNLYTNSKESELPIWSAKFKFSTYTYKGSRPEYVYKYYSLERQIDRFLNFCTDSFYNIYYRIRNIFMYREDISVKNLVMNEVVYMDSDENGLHVVTPPEYDHTKCILVALSNDIYISNVRYPYYDCCSDCGKKYGTYTPGVIGMWEGKCPICGETKSLAAARHDFGLYNIESSVLTKKS